MKNQSMMEELKRVNKLGDVTLLLDTFIVLIQKDAFSLGPLQLDDTILVNFNSENVREEAIQFRNLLQMGINDEVPDKFENLKIFVGECVSFAMQNCMLALLDESKLKFAPQFIGSLLILYDLLGHLSDSEWTITGNLEKISAL